jgi:hypothetical protein
MDPVRLASVLNIDTETSGLPQLRPATLRDGRLRIWADKYAALVDEPGGEVQGCVYPICSLAEEEALRSYEGDSYEVVRGACMLWDWEMGEVEVRTFRFCGADAELALRDRYREKTRARSEDRWSTEAHEGVM